MCAVINFIIEFYKVAFEVLFFNPHAQHPIIFIIYFCAFVAVTLFFAYLPIGLYRLTKEMLDI